MKSNRNFEDKLMNLLPSGVYRVGNYKLQDTKHFQNVMLVGMASEISKNYIHTSVWIARDATESRVPRLKVHPKQN